MTPEIGIGLSPARSTVIVSGRLIGFALNPRSGRATPSKSLPVISGVCPSLEETGVAPRDNAATLRPPSNSSGTNHACSGLAGGASRSTAISAQPVVKLPSSSVAAIVIRTGTPPRTSGSNLTVTGTVLLWPGSTPTEDCPNSTDQDRSLATPWRSRFFVDEPSFAIVRSASTRWPSLQYGETVVCLGVSVSCTC